MQAIIVYSVYIISNRNKKSLWMILLSPIIWYMAPWISPIQLASLFFLWGYYFITVVIAAIIGIFVGIIFNFDYRLSLLAGYAGTDILEGIYKSFAVQKVYVNPKSKK